MQAIRRALRRARGHRVLVTYGLAAMVVLVLAGTMAVDAVRHAGTTSAGAAAPAAPPVTTTTAGSKPRRVLPSSTTTTLAPVTSTTAPPPDYTKDPEIAAAAALRPSHLPPGWVESDDEWLTLANLVFYDEACFRSLLAQHWGQTAFEQRTLIFDIPEERRTDPSIDFWVRLYESPMLAAKTLTEFRSGSIGECFRGVVERMLEARLDEEVPAEVRVQLSPLAATDVGDGLAGVEWAGWRLGFEVSIAAPDHEGGSGEADIVMFQLGRSIVAYARITDGVTEFAPDVGTVGRGFVDRLQATSLSAER